MILSKIIFNQNHGIKLMEMFTLINDFETHAFLCPFHRQKCHFFRVFDIKFMQDMTFFSFLYSLGYISLLLSKNQNPRDLLMGTTVFSSLGSLLSNFCCTYFTVKTIQVRHTYVGVIYRILQLVVITYIGL